MKTIALLFRHDLNYCRGVLRGITEYAVGRPNWTLTPVNPDRAGLRSLRASRPSGVIAHAFDRAIDVQVSRLRHRLEDDARDPKLIKTVRNQGYVLAAEVVPERR